jgi:hypothetical protein
MKEVMQVNIRIVEKTITNDIYFRRRIRVMMFNATVNNISAISWRLLQ